MSDACHNHQHHMIRDAAGRTMAACQCEVAHCECCDDLTLLDELILLSGEMIHACPACRKFVRECGGCGRDYLTVEALNDGCAIEDAMIHQDRDGRWLCDECRAKRREAEKWEGANMRRKRLQEEGF